MEYTLIIINNMIFYYPLHNNYHYMEDYYSYRNNDFDFDIKLYQNLAKAVNDNYDAYQEVIKYERFK